MWKINTLDVVLSLHPDYFSFNRGLSINLSLNASLIHISVTSTVNKVPPGYSKGVTGKSHINSWGWVLW